MSRRKVIEGFFWPLWPPWRYTPMQWALRLYWNACELLRIPAPGAHWVFGVIIGSRPRRIDRNDDAGK